MLQHLRSHRGLAVAVVSYYVGFLALGVATDNGQVLLYAVFMAILIGVVALWDSRRHLSSAVLTGLALWGALHMAGGLIPLPDEQVLYNLWLLPFLRFDHLVHAIGFGFAGLAFWEAARPALGPALMSGAAIIFVGGVGLGAVNEMIEFLITRVVSDTNVGGFDNTGWDLVANAVGAALAAVWVRRQWARGQTPRIVEG
ncbi:MAG: hypothetical protein ACRDZM_14020 [Acidimicrobiia bacterium]